MQAGSNAHDTAQWLCRGSPGTPLWPRLESDVSARSWPLRPGRAQWCERARRASTARKARWACCVGLPGIHPIEDIQRPRRRPPNRSRLDRGRGPAHQGRELFDHRQNQRLTPVDHGWHPAAGREIDHVSRRFPAWNAGLGARAGVVGGVGGRMSGTRLGHEGRMAYGAGALKFCVAKSMNRSLSR
jgi:hypothetical protein